MSEQQSLQRAASAHLPQIKRTLRVANGARIKPPLTLDPAPATRRSPISPNSTAINAALITGALTARYALMDTTAAARTTLAA